MEAQQTKSVAVTILHNATIVTMDPDARVFRNGGVVIERDAIVAVGQSSDILHQFSSLAHQIFDLNGQIVLPGPPSHWFIISMFIYFIFQNTEIIENV